MGGGERSHRFTRFESVRAIALDHRFAEFHQVFVRREVGAIHYGKDGFETIAFDFGPTAHLEVLFGAVLQNRLIVEVGAHQLLHLTVVRKHVGAVDRELAFV